MSFWDDKEIKTPRKPYTKRLNYIHMLCGFPFYNELSIVTTSKAFKGYARS